MKIAVNGKEIMELTDIQKQVLAHEYSSSVVESEIIKDLQWILSHKLERCTERLKKEWTPQLIATGATAVPLKYDKFAETVFAHKDYKDRTAREAEAEAVRVAAMEQAKLAKEEL